MGSLEAHGQRMSRYSNQSLEQAFQSRISVGDKKDARTVCKKTEKGARHRGANNGKDKEIKPVEMEEAGTSKEVLTVIKDVLAKAKTGTGKTVAFLQDSVSGVIHLIDVCWFQLPSIEVVIKSPPVGRDQKRPSIFVLVMCPTRELANQAATYTEANTLLKYHPSIGVQVVIGGTRLTLEQKRMQTNPCQILVATPGRLNDHIIENTAGFATRLMGVKVLVLDEADHLLDMRFRKDIEKIIAAVPKQRQTLLFSATVSEEVYFLSLFCVTHVRVPYIQG
ncbi:hypothetical protein LWI28_011494 [Acer negundo]|uniref:ATP-dependent RNA helicase n=1 Tax=Acer negundo TaxID=4023 RepID=A0AAD5IYW6_ACENE|nr:hypothetical protein LWI28_011494 [Acer negundo]